MFLAAIAWEASGHSLWLERVGGALTFTLAK